VTTFQVMPPLTDEERAALRADIEEHGVLVPVVRDQHGNVLDGHNRAAIADELGVDYRVDIVSVEDDRQARTIARQLNLARRHLSRAQKRQLIADEIEAAPDRSDREIARLMGCDHKTVGSVRRELRGELPRPPVSDAEYRAARESVDRIKDGFHVADQSLIDSVTRNGCAPAVVAQALRDARTSFREQFAETFGDDFAVTDEMLFGQRLDFLGAAQVLAGDREWIEPADPAAVAWLEAWAEARPKQHAEHIQIWAEVWPAQPVEIGV
jgi:hypothetical protein